MKNSSDYYYYFYEYYVIIIIIVFVIIINLLLLHIITISYHYDKDDWYLMINNALTFSEIDIYIPVFLKQ